MTPERKTHLQYAAFILGIAGADMELPTGARERLGMMAGRIALELDVIEGVAGSLDTREYAPGPTVSAEVATRAPVASPPNVPVPYKEPAKVPREVPHVRVSQCIDGHMNHRWDGVRCTRCNKRR